jgi:hypothetical protein
MALLNLSLVTQALTALLKKSVESSPEWPSEHQVDVSPLPPDKLSGERTLGLYLYHITEDAHRKNLPAPGDSSAPVRFNPMGLQLYYLLTARSLLSDMEAALRTEQLLMGLAMKAFHDVPVVDDTTVVNGKNAFPPNLAGSGNRLRLVLQPTPPSEAVHYWTAGSHPLRLAVHYQVSVVLLESEPETVRTGRVLSYGVHSFLRGAPRLNSSSNRIVFTVPGEKDARTLECQPAEVPVGGEVEFTGTGLAGANTSLWLRGPGWRESLEADPLQWSVSATSERVMATVQPGIGAKAEPILPGIYTARVEVTTERGMPDGSVRQFRASSNETPFAIAPQADDPDFPGGEAIVTGGNFDPGLLPADAVQVFVGIDRISRVDSDPVPPGAFRALSSTELRIRLPAEAKSGLPLRILVRGVESAPRWVRIP